MTTRVMTREERAQMRDAFTVVRMHYERATASTNTPEGNRAAGEWEHVSPGLDLLAEMVGEIK